MMKQAKAITISVLSVMAVIFMMTALAGCGGSSGISDGDVDGDSSLCGKNQHLEGGVCTCDTGYVPGGEGCVPAGDGDFDSNDSDTDGDNSDTDREKTDSDVDDTDGDSSDTDNSDGDTDSEENQLCTCPVIDDEFCIDPEIPGALYKRVLVTPGSNPGCSLHLVVYDAFHAAFSGGLTCNEEGRAPIPAIGCVLTYDLADEKLSLICGAEIFNLRHAWCQTPDGDDDFPVDGDDESVDADNDESVDGDDDKPFDGDDDIDNDQAGELDDDPDSNIDSDNDTAMDGDVTPCDDHGDCPSTHYCLPTENVCVPDLCNNDLAMYCPPFYMCDQWGMCIPDGTGGDDDNIVDGDTSDSDADSGCTSNDQCAEHFRCLLGSCVVGCTSNIQCPPESYCDYHGNCIFGGGDVDAVDVELEEGCTCAVTNAETGEDTCGAGTYCNSECQCVWDCIPGVVLCQENLGCWCSDKGRCECPQQGCDSDSACGTGEFCNVNFECQTGCPTVPCPQGMYCYDDHGHCDAESLDGDLDQDSAIPCTSDVQCPVGNHCGAANTCTYVCQSNIECQDDYVCDLYGRCVEDLSECRQFHHEDCGAGYYCGSDSMCHQDCTTDDWCHATYNQAYSCNSHGICEILPADGDEELPPFYCNKDEDCQPLHNYHYCVVETHTCVQGCSNHNECDAGYLCSIYGRCEQMADWDPDEGGSSGWCDSDDDCPDYAGAYPSAQYCGPGRTCQFDCFYGAEDDGCPPDKYCDGEGRCQVCGGDMECGQNYIYCDSVGGCPVGMHCDTKKSLNICVTECPCPSHLTCDSFGFCIIPQADSDSDPVESDDDYSSPGVLCAGPGDCPLHSYCDLTMEIPECTIDCLLDEHCSPGYYCNCRGQCHSDPDFGDCFPALTCTAQWQCPYDVPCEDIHGGQYCNIHCMYPSFGCEANQECDDLTGYCVDVQVDGDTDIDSGDNEPDSELFGCFTDEDCPNAMYCGSDSLCTSDCVPTRGLSACAEPAPDCPGDQICSERGRCTKPMLECEADADCPMGSYCLSIAGLSYCLIGCSLDSDCSSSGKVCDTSHGRCVDDGSQNPNPVYPSCSTDCDCPLYSRCEDNSCVTDCIIDQGCSLGVEYCSFTGTCEPYADGDTDSIADGDAGGSVGCKPDLACSDDTYCPYHSHCDLSLGECSSFCSFDSHCQVGKVCTDKGECVTPPYAWDGSGHDLLLGCGSDADCPKGTYCWAEGSVCRLDCICGEEGGSDILTCSNGGVCDYLHGRCNSAGSGK